MSEPVAAVPQRQLTLFDTTNIIVGIIIGSSIYEATPWIAASLPGPGWLVGVWLLGGLLSLIGALCYAELATAYPTSGGDYVYLNRSFGRAVGFLFAWSQLWVVRPGSIGAMAFVFARYANELCPLGEGAVPLLIYAVASILALTAINVLGVPQGKRTQNVLTVAKVLGLAAVCAVGLLWTSAPPAAATAVPAQPLTLGCFYLPMILIFYAFGGWNEMAYVAAEVRQPEKNIFRALVLGTMATTAIYVLVTLAFVHALGFPGVASAKAVAADVLALPLGLWGRRLISLLICISALGAINGLIFTGARIYYAMGKDHRLYASLGRWNQRLGTPVNSLLVQALITLPLVVYFGRSDQGFTHLVNFTTPVFWMFFLLVGLSLFVLRWREPHTPRPYRAPLYPLVPLLFCASSLFMVYASVTWAVANKSSDALWSIALLAIGVLLAAWETVRTSVRQ
jgi:APA family basic amino acid/polyamine antiporter